MGKLESIKIRFLGGVREVGRSAVVLNSEHSGVLLDYGVQVDRDPDFPLHIPPKDLDGIILTHAHLDHSGGIPIFYFRSKLPLYSTELTLRLSKILINDFLKLAGYYLPYEHPELEAMVDNGIFVEYGETFQVGKFRVKFLEAGHIPGSAQLLVEVDGKKIVYTSDLNVLETRLLKGADLDYGEISAIILESTYAVEDHPDRLEMEKLFVGRVREVVEAGGTVLVPAFSVGRSQEVLCVLEAHGFEYSVFMDGMALEVNEIMLQHPLYFRDYALLRRALEKARWITQWRERREAVRQPCVIVSPAGMLKGGAAAFYVEKVAKEKRNAIFLVSYQIPGTPGRVLLEQRKIYSNGKLKPVEAEVEKFSFSSHSGSKELKTLLKTLQGNPVVYTVHGEDESCQALARWVEEELGFKAYAPKPGEIFEL
ncbi:MBL fold metallo-hydrolase [Candidatus Hecatella orcuttiae]|jgi:putative mRNA 3-end processing factor|uniref:MBL fold metallo-hydrolase n=1 Tax=Candidatus Hecatella orcuttiae TaxID=1935119 RepID=UPI002867DEFE|nr:MBL fold metallo-hydrolase [Candidatus Hecatella orcuttiae]